MKGPTLSSLYIASISVCRDPQGAVSRGHALPCIERGGSLSPEGVSCDGVNPWVHRSPEGRLCVGMTFQWGGH